MSEEDKHFIKRYEELLDKGYCDCNEMNCIDNNSPRRILNIVKNLQNQLQQKENIIKEYKKHIKNINEWLNHNTEIGNLYWYDATPFPELKLSNEKSEVS